MKQPETFDDIFEPRPKTWGLRGDPYLWDDMSLSLGLTPLPRSFSDFALQIETLFEGFTGAKISDRGNVFVKRYSHGGMSSGYISLEFWQRKGFPLLLERFSRRFQKEP